MRSIAIGLFWANVVFCGFNLGVGLAEGEPLIFVVAALNALGAIVVYPLVTSD